VLGSIFLGKITALGRSVKLTTNILSTSLILYQWNYADLVAKHNTDITVESCNTEFSMPNLND